MGKIETYTKNRIEGALWALKIIEKETDTEKGVEALRKELRSRRASFIPLEIPQSRIHEVSTMLAKRSINTILTTLLKVFEEEYGWGAKRLKRLSEQFAKHSGHFAWEDPYGDTYIRMSELARQYRAEYGIRFTDDDLDQMCNVERQREEARVRRVQWDVIEKQLKHSYPDALEHLRKVVKP